MRRQWSLLSLADATTIANELGGMLNEEQIAAIDARNATLFGDGGEVARELPRIREELALKKPMSVSGF